MAESSTNGKGKDEDREARPANSGRSTTTHESAPGDDAAEGGPAGDDLDVLKRGAMVGRYLVLERLGAGAMGVVYAAYDPELDRKVAIKLLRPDEGRGDPVRRRARLVREAKAMAKLSHANVGAIFDVGVHEGQVFLAIEYLPGGTLRSWLAAEKRPWRDIVRMFVEIGNGLAAAHAEGLIHRDFKPDNVLLDKAGKPKVVDFGLVRLTAALDVSTTGSLDDPDLPIAETAIPASAPVGAAALTRTGALAGTPAYMAPEQFLGQPIDARTDQFAFCVALYEALYGERPFAGDTMVALADSVTSERLRLVPRNTEVPTWIRNAIVRGLRSAPSGRYPGFGPLLVALSDDPITRRRRQFFVTSAFIVVLGGALATRQMLVRRHAEIERQILQHLLQARAAGTQARAKLAEAKALRQTAFQAFAARRRDDGEGLWRRTRSLIPTIDSSYDHASREYESALTLDRARASVRTELASVHYEQIIFCEEFGLQSRVEILKERLASGSDDTTLQALSAPGTLTIVVSPATVRTTLQRYDHDPVTGRLLARDIGPVKPGDPPLTVAPGSYRIALRASDSVDVLYPFEVRRQEQLVIQLEAPRATMVPAGFVYVPPGPFWFGEANEDLRTGFLEATPIRPVDSPGYLIARDETTFDDWMTFLRSIPAEKRRQYLPRGGRVATDASIELLNNNDDEWELVFRPSGHTYRAALGSPIVYNGRDRRRTQDWRRFPVTGVSPESAMVYADWLRTSGRIPGARLCSELEWERAARGADKRTFPHGDHLDPDDANFDVTYGRSSGYGPDEVGSHPISTSAFGVHDMAGNVWEIVRSSVDPTGFVVRGGSFYQFEPAQRVTNRNPVAATTRDDTVGIRICASLPTAEASR